MSREPLPPEKVVELLPSPIVNLARELQKAEDGSEDHAKLTEVFRLLAVKANAVLFRIASNRIAAEARPGAFDDMDHDIGEDIEGHEPVDTMIGLQGKKNAG